MDRSRRARRPSRGLLLADFARRVRERFPGAPEGEELRVARFACRSETERVGALGGSDGYLEHAVELAVLAHLRHRHTRYEALLEQGYDRESARALVQPRVLELFARWGRPPEERGA